MIRLFQNLRRGMQLLALLSLCACGPKPQPQEQVTTADPVMERAAATVDDYVVKSKHWNRGSYEITFNRKEGTTLVFWVVHSDDKAAVVPGAGKSIEVHVDTGTNEVSKELGFQ